jgi:hypothetical protein
MSAFVDQDFVTAQLTRAELRRYAVIIYAAALLVPALHQCGAEGRPLLAMLAQSDAGRRLVIAPSAAVRRTLARTMFDETLLLCRDDEPLLALMDDLFEVLNNLRDNPDVPAALRPLAKNLTSAIAHA